MMRKAMGAAAIACAAVVLGLSGCNAGSESGVVREESAKTQPAQGKTAEARAAALYRAVVDDPVRYFEGLQEQGRTEGVQFSYALVRATDGDVPTLLLRATGPMESWNGISQIVPLMVDSGAKELVVPEGWYAEGAAGAGGFRGQMSCSAYGDGLLLSEVSSGSGAGTISRIVWNGHGWEERIACDTQIGANLATDTLISDESVDIPWVDISGDDTDLSCLDALEKGSWTPAIEEPESSMDEAAEKMGLLVVSGTMHRVDRQALLDLQGIEDPNPGTDDASVYAVFVPDEPCEITATSGDGMGTSTGQASMFLVDSRGDESSWGAYKDQRVTVALDGTHLHWPSDTSLPVGEPRVMPGGIAVLSMK